jgi:hypothetical protein
LAPPGLEPGINQMVDASIGPSPCHSTLANAASF